MEEPKYNECFACGENHPFGLKLKFRYEDDNAIAEWDCPAVFAGYPGIIHGGIISTILDEAMAKIVIMKIGEAVTGKMTVNYRKPLNVGAHISIIGTISETKGRIIKTSAKIMAGDNLIAEATAIYVKVGKS